MKKNILFLLFVTVSGYIFGQVNHLVPEIRTAVYYDVTPPLSQMPRVEPGMNQEKQKEVPNKIGRRELAGLKSNHFPFPEDPVWQKQDGTDMPLVSAPIQNFDGMPNISGYYPPDTQGDISTDKYVQVVNVSFAIYSKTGATIMAPALLNTLWAGIPAPWNGTNNGDPIVLYDQEADRWLISQFSLPYGGTGGSYAELIAVSQTSDPTGAWYRYVYQFGNTMPDYPKFGIWQDGYYMSINQFTGGSTWGGVGACAFDRTKMLAGDPTAAMVYFNLGATGDPESMLPSDWDGVVAPLPGEPNHFTYFNDWTPGVDDFLKIWDFHVDWVTPANSTFAEVNSLVTAPFDSDLCLATRERCIPQPGTTIKLESLSDRVMYRLQYRNFGGYSAMVTNHTVDVDATGHAGIRWYELRNSGSAWSIYQQGTYSPDASHRWVGSIAMNSVGDIALGYSVSDATTTYPSIRYTGRKPGDPLGTMTSPEQTIVAGSGSQTGTSARWGDYSMMSIDPSDDITFWFTTEYVEVTGLKTWKTRIASFLVSNAPSAISMPASAITATSATLNGTVNPHGLSTTYQFEYGTTSTYGNFTSTLSAGSGSSDLPVTANLTGLIPGTPYYYRLVATNTDGTSRSSRLAFTPGGALLTTMVPSLITGNSASSGGDITSDGGSAVTARGVCWGPSLNPIATGNHTTNGSGAGAFSSAITGLASNTPYHVRAYATNGTGTYYGNDIMFTTGCGVLTPPISEGFPNSAIPVCWSQTDNQGNGQVWSFGALTSYGSENPALTGNYAFLNSDAYGSSGSQNADLVTPTIDLSNFATVSLSFNHYFRYYTGSSATVSYSINNGTTWVPLQSFTAATANPEAFNQSIAAAAGQPAVKFKWNYTGTWGYYWAVDDIQITGLPINRQVSTVTIPTGVSNCYNAMQTITLAGSGNTFMVQNGGSATLIAGLKISVLPGAAVQPGGYFWGYIAPSGPFCVNPTFNMPGQNETLSGETPGLTTPLKDELFMVYPNPTSGQFTLELGTSAEAFEKVEVMIYAVTGVVVLKESMETIRKTDFSLAGKPNGIYLIQVIAGSRNGTARIIKQ